MNEIIDGCNSFKIGKTGDPDQRASDYDGYSAMYLLCASKSAKLIEELEAHYIDAYYGDNDNEIKGSAGRMSKDAGIYFLYVVTS